MHAALLHDACTTHANIKQHVHTSSSSSSGQPVLEPQAEAFHLLSMSVVAAPTDDM